MIAVFFAIFFCRLWDAVEAIACCLCCCRCPWLWQCLCRSNDQQPVADIGNENYASSLEVVDDDDSDDDGGESAADTSLGTVRNDHA
jgi:hypothetical protein